MPNGNTSKHVYKSKSKSENPIFVERLFIQTIVHKAYTEITSSRTVVKIVVVLNCTQTRFEIISLLTSHSCSNSTNKKSNSSCSNAYSNDTICMQQHEKAVRQLSNEEQLWCYLGSGGSKFLPLAILSSMFFFRVNACLQSGAIWDKKSFNITLS